MLVTKVTLAIMLSPTNAGATRDTRAMLGMLDVRQAGAGARMVQDACQDTVGIF